VARHGAEAVALVSATAREEEAAHVKEAAKMLVHKDNCRRADEGLFRFQMVARQNRAAAMPARMSRTQITPKDASSALTALSGWLSANVSNLKQPPSFLLQKPVDGLSSAGTAGVSKTYRAL
jgi:hypothetical protein